MTYPIYLLVGQAASGKDTVAGMIKDSTAHCHVIAFAEPIKEFAQRVFDIDKASLYGASALRDNFITSFPADQRARFFFTSTREWVETILPTQVERGMAALEAWFEGIQRKQATTGVTIRYVLQTLGTEWGRALDRDIWVKETVRRARILLSNGVNAVVISDGRFRSEVLAVKELGGTIINVVNGNQPIWAPTNVHKSESEQSSIPAYWYNYRVTNFFEGLDSLRVQVNRLAMKLKMGPDM